MWKKHKWKIIIPVLLVVALAAAFYFGGNGPAGRGWGTIPAGSSARAGADETAAAETEAAASETAAGAAEGAAPVAPPDEARQEAADEEAAPAPGPAEEIQAAHAEGPAEGETPAEPAGSAEPEIPTEAEPPAEPEAPAEAEPPAEPEAPAEPETPAEPEATATVTISISCATVLDHLDWLDAATAELIPADGWMLSPVQTELQEGETAFDVLLRVTREYRIHFEYSETPLYGSAYLEGIGNLYEMDCGGSSGWMYSVNGWFPNYGCSQYVLQPGDVLCLLYTCDLGKDIGGSNAVG